MLKDILQNLSKEDKQQLMIAFDEEFSQFIELPGERFIGVNIEPGPDFVVIETRGQWSYGELCNADGRQQEPPAV